MNNQKKILLIAPFSKPEMTSWLIARAFSYIGLSAERFDYRHLAMTYGAEQMNQMLKAEIQKLPGGSLCLILKGDLIDPTIFEGRWDLKRAAWLFDFDAFEPHEWFRKLGRWMTAVFLMCYPWVEKLREFGVNAFFLPQATDSLIYMPVQNVQPTCHVAFIGTYKPGRYEILQRVNEKFNLEIWGEQWKPAGFKLGIPAYLDEFNLACSKAMIVLNITSSPDWPIYEKTFSQRIYMAASCQACILTDKIPGMNEFFAPGEIFEYEPDNLLEQIEILIKDEKLRKAAGRAARMRVLKEHQYVHRIKEMLPCLGLSPYALRNSRA